MNEIELPLCCSGPFTSCSIELEQYFYVENTIVDWLTSRKRPVKKSRLNLRSKKTPTGFAESAFFAHLTLNGASNKVAHNR